MSASLSRADQQRLQRLSEANEPTLDGDRRFFARHTGRSYRIRLASAAEVETNRLLGEQRTAPPGCRWHVVVRQAVQDVRLRFFFMAPAGTDADQPEAACRRVHRLMAGSEWIGIGDEAAAAVGREA